MNIFTEIMNRITSSMRKKLDVPADHPRPQDDIPEERIVHRVVADYQRMYNERQALIDYIRAMEKMYKNAQMGLFIAVTKNKAPTRKKQLDITKKLLYDMTSHHMTAQKMLRRSLWMQEETENNFITDETIISYGRTEEE